MTYLDTSALVKRFVSEAGSSEVQSLFLGGGPVASATIAYAEMYSGAEILSSARGLIQRHGLRAFDAIHLASALGLQAAANEPVTLVAADQRLLRAAAGERLATVNPEAARGRSDR